jgi:hypothetical protein
VANKQCDAGLAGPTTPNSVRDGAMPEQGSVPKTGPALGMLAAGAQAMPLWRRDEAIPSQ